MALCTTVNIFISFHILSTFQRLASIASFRLSITSRACTRFPRLAIGSSRTGQMRSIGLWTPSCPDARARGGADAVPVRLYGPIDDLRSTSRRSRRADSSPGAHMQRTTLPALAISEQLLLPMPNLSACGASDIWLVRLWPAVPQWSIDRGVGRWGTCPAPHSTATLLKLSRS